MEVLLILGEVSGTLSEDGLIQKGIEFDASSRRQFDLPVAMIGRYYNRLLKKGRRL